MGELKESQRVGDCRTAATDSLGHQLLGQTEIFHQLLVGRGLFERVEILAMQVLDQRMLEGGGVFDLPNDRPNVQQSGSFCGAPATLAAMIS